ncbi:hypothetical protein MOB65_20440 [Bacillus inaquosorum]|uniref:hypothetical protein n=1 Tax=Bacillus inaquosorum TaxID=483913 RepID=UPI00227F5DE4|nr:hypothetical protein [Bacillus inaquosorum]MCY7911228.1 hypothetical protein [Bacillus inaquosorum]MCY8228824.1 hypothetical protein [Bacillus spizizenii]
MRYTIKEVQEYIESLDYFKKVVFVEEQEGDSMFFDAINHNGVDVSIRADVENEVSIDKWNFYVCCDEYDWNNIDFIYR